MSINRLLKVLDDDDYDDDDYRKIGLPYRSCDLFSSACFDRFTHSDKIKKNVHNAWPLLLLKPKAQLLPSKHTLVNAHICNKLR